MASIFHFHIFARTCLHLRNSPLIFVFSVHLSLVLQFSPFCSEWDFYVASQDIGACEDIVKVEGITLLPPKSILYPRNPSSEPDTPIQYSYTNNQKYSSLQVCKEHEGIPAPRGNNEIGPICIMAGCFRQKIIGPTYSVTENSSLKLTS